MAFVFVCMAICLLAFGYLTFHRFALTRIVYKNKKYQIIYYKNRQEIPDEFDVDSKFTFIDVIAWFSGPIIMIIVSGIYCDYKICNDINGWLYFIAATFLAIAIPPLWTSFRSVIVIIQIIIRTKKIG